jgi:hypothetical protein
MLLTEGNFVALCQYYNSTKLPTPPYNNKKINLNKLKKKKKNPLPA